ncbi:MAG: S41 family peptidase [Alistipes sp.]
MKHSLFLWTLLVMLSCAHNATHSQQTHTKTYNLDFETVVNGAPEGWQSGGNKNYTCAVDTILHVSGNHSLSIEYKGDEPQFGAWSLTIPHRFEGEKITLSGYIKTEQVEDGHAGLWMRLDPQMGFDNMGNRGIKGTTDWTKYAITLPLSSDKIKTIVVGGLLVGRGKMWIDNLQIEIDGKEIALLEPVAAKSYPADNDKEFAQSSGVTRTMLERLTNKELTELGLIWGYVKYYHPALQRGDYNWDAALFRLLPHLCSAKSVKARETLITKWIDNLGTYEQSTEAMETKQAKLLPDVNWITTSKFSKELTTRLLQLKNAKREGHGYYINFADYVGNPLFTNEHNPTALYPDAGYRLLSVYRYWNMIQYFYPNRHLIGEDWVGVLKREIPAAVAATTQAAYDFAMLDLIGCINDTHANIWAKLEPLERWRGLNLAIPKIKFVENKAVVAGFYSDSETLQLPLQMGDVLLTINQKPVEQIVAERLNRTPASNLPTKLRDIARELLRSNEGQIAVTYQRNGESYDAVLKTFTPGEVNRLFSFSDAPKNSFRMVTDEIAYLYMGTLKGSDCPALFKQIQPTQGLIIDLRCYPSDFSALYMLGAYIISKPTIFFKVTTGSGVHPGLFTFSEGNKVGAYSLFPYKGQVVILVDETTQSAAEFMAMAFRTHPNALVIGSTTAGADGNVSQIELPGDIMTYISGIGIINPDGSETQRVGIVPNIEAKPTLKGVRDGRDEVLERAITAIHSNK